MKKILLVSAKNIERGGVEAFLINWVSHIQKEKYEIHWYFPGIIKNENIANEFTKKNVVLIPGKQTGMAINRILNVFFKVYNLSRNNHYSIIHINTGSVLTSAAALIAAKLRKVKIRIAHSHSTGDLICDSIIKKTIYPIGRFFVNLCATKKAACSKLAAEALFGKRYAKYAIIIPNYIDTKKFAFSNDIRQKERQKLGLEDNFIIGQVARLSHEKNQKFLIDMFECVFKNDNSARLLLVGSGSLEDELKNYAKEKKLEDYIIFTGAADNPQDYYNIMDVFVLPSLFEGLPITGIEAQASGLPCIFSNNISREVELTDTCKFILLSESLNKWADVILSFKEYPQYKRKFAHKTIDDKGFGTSNLKEIIDILYEQ